MEDSKFLKFTLHCWVDYRKFKRASRSCAILLNLFLLIFKIALCGVALLLLAPHMAANHLLNRPTRGIPNRVLYVFFVLLCFAVDLPVLLGSAAVVVGGIQCILSHQILTGFVMSTVGSLTGWWSLKCVLFVFSRHNTVDENDDFDEEEELTEEEQEVVEEEPINEDDELRFCQLFHLGGEMCVLIDHIEMCPDETAFIRVVDDEGYTPLYKRKVKRDKAKNRFIVFNGTNYYLDDSKTQPIIPKK